MAQSGFPETDKPKQVPSGHLPGSDDRINLLSVQPSALEANGCNAPHTKAEEQLKKKVADKHDVYVNAQSGPKGCVYKYNFLWSDDLGVQLETPANASGLKQADAALSQREAAKSEELARNYGVVFGTEGQFIRNSLTVRNGKVVPGPPLIADKMPLSQLIGIAAAFKQSSPDVTPAAGAKAIEFFSSHKRQPENGLVAADYNAPTAKQQPKITLYPMSDITPVTSESARAQFAKMQKLSAELQAYAPDHKPLPEAPFELHSIQQTVEHELAHHAEHRIGWDDLAKSDKFALAMGWIPDPLLSSAKKHSYMLSGKNGEYFESLGFSSKDGQTEWMALDKQGLPILTGNDRHLTFYTDEQVAERAVIKPASSYFTSPLEEMAEAMSHLRDSAQSRRELLEKSPALYFEAKREDQLDINVTYGLDKSGAPNYIRGLDGQLIPNQPETPRTISMFEERVQRAQNQHH